MKTLKKTLSLLCLLLVLSPGWVLAQEKPEAESVEQLVDRIQAFYEKIQDFSSQFEQRYHYKAFDRTQVSSGRVFFKKPARMRWDYEKPTKRSFLLTENQVLALDTAAMTLTKTTLEMDKLSAAVTFLWGRGKLKEEFNISQVECKGCKEVRLELVPKKEEPRFQKLFLDVNPKTAQVMQSTVVDPDGSENRIRFLNWKENQNLKPETFRLSVPDGTQFLDMTKAAEARP
jgi:outer membrane lipoprotein carrier protein